MGVNGVSAEQRHTHGRRCPICGGADRDQRGKGRRCHGFVSGDGYAHCSREEHSGGLMITKGDTYGHRLVGPCNCGTTHSSDDSGWKDIEAAYDYRDERGMLLFQVVRLVGKNFRQRKPDGYGGFDWSTAGVRRVLYQLPALLAAPRDAMFYIVEGEKDADTIRAAGGIATCNPMGAGKWSMVDENARQALAGRHVVIIPDRDDAGRAHGAQVAAALHGVAATLRLLELPKKDVTEWFEAGGTLAELQQIAEHVEPASVAETKPKERWHRCPDLVDLILSRAAEPMVTLTLGGDPLITVRAGGIVIAMGPTGAGKTSLIAGMLVEHPGPVAVLSRELPADELAARVIGMQCDASWLDVLTGKVQRADMERALDRPQMIILDRRNATLTHLIEAIKALREQYPDQPILVAVDYVQILESGETEIRAKVADIIAQIDDIAREYRVFVIAISQMSRAASKAALAGESMGADSTGGGAESAAIERVATATFQIGASGPNREDGTRAVDLSIGKGRMVGGDRVIPMSYCGRSGRWRVAGESRPASEVRAEREGARDVAKQTAAELAIVAAAGKSKEPRKREELSSVAACSNSIRRAAVAALLSRGELVEVRQKAPRSRAWKVWTPARADAAGVPIIDAGGDL